MARVPLKKMPAPTPPVAVPTSEAPDATINLTAAPSDTRRTEPQQPAQSTRSSHAPGYREFEPQTLPMTHEQWAQIERLAARLNETRKRTGSSQRRITKNTVLRAAADLIIEVAHEIDAAATQDEIRNQARQAIRHARG